VESLSIPEEMVRTWLVSLGKRKWVMVNGMGKGWSWKILRMESEGAKGDVEDELDILTVIEV